MIIYIIILAFILAIISVILYKKSTKGETKTYIPKVFSNWQKTAARREDTEIKDGKSENESDIESDEEDGDEVLDGTTKSTSFKPLKTPPPPLVQGWDTYNKRYTSGKLSGMYVNSDDVVGDISPESRLTNIDLEKCKSMCSKLNNCNSIEYHNDRTCIMLAATLDDTEHFKQNESGTKIVQKKITNPYKKPAPPPPPPPPPPPRRSTAEFCVHFRTSSTRVPSLNCPPLQSCSKDAREG